MRRLRMRNASSIPPGCQRIRGEKRNLSPKPCYFDFNTFMNTNDADLRPLYDAPTTLCSVDDNGLVWAKVSVAVDSVVVAHVASSNVCAIGIVSNEKTYPTLVIKTYEHRT